MISLLVVCKNCLEWFQTMVANNDFSDNNLITWNYLSDDSFQETFGTIIVQFSDNGF